MIDNFDPKALKRLADTCRKAGIDSFKGYGIEFTLAPQTNKPKRTRKKSTLSTETQQFLDTLEETTIETDELDPESLLFYSVGPDPLQPPEGSES